MFIASETIVGQDILISEGLPLLIQVTTTNVGDTANITWESGVIPFFPATIDTASKFFSQSGIVFYVDRDRNK